MANSSAFFAHDGDLSGGDVLRKNAALFQGHTLVHGGRGNWDPNGRPQTTEVQAFLGFPAQFAACQIADIPGAAPVNVTLTLNENESKVKYYFLVFLGQAGSTQSLIGRPGDIHSQNLALQD